MRTCRVWRVICDQVGLRNGPGFPVSARRSPAMACVTAVTSADCPAIGSATEMVKARPRVSCQWATARRIQVSGYRSGGTWTATSSTSPPLGMVAQP
ncbi:hypothetical protein [Paractinoplanes maris]|uniref:hypothetical protein n=1 Tax=Paractinoplanes maris TaxID=1734446 RepID=UPI002020E869|nr:hypothetical protein [Actinoplanes maris]